MQHVFLVGAPRSGTTWLQTLLAEHPSIVTSQETHLFSGYLGQWFTQWEREGKRAGSRAVGLRNVIDEDEFLLMIRAAADVVFNSIAARKPNATMVLEKTPIHVLYVPLILKVYPDARFIHIVRDPRSVVASLRAAGKTWGATWRGIPLLGLAERWYDYAGAGASLVAESDAAVQLRYEDLLESTSARLRELTEWLALDNSCWDLDDVAARGSFSAMKSREKGALSTTPEPDGFFRKGGASNWMVDLTPFDIALVEAVGGERMEAFGYPFSEGRSAAMLRRVARLRLAVRGAARRPAAHRPRAARNRG